MMTVARNGCLGDLIEDVAGKDIRKEYERLIDEEKRKIFHVAYQEGLKMRGVILIRGNRQVVFGFCVPSEEG